MHSQDLEKRIEALETSNRHQRYVLAAGGIVLVAVFTLGAVDGEKVHDVLKARRIEVVDSDGDAKITLEYRSSAEMRSFYRQMDATNDADELILEEWISNATEQASISLSLSTLISTTIAPDGIRIYDLRDPKPGGTLDGLSVINRQGRVRIGTREHGGFIEIKNGEGEYQVYLGTTEGGSGSVSTFNGKGKELVSLTATEDGGKVFTNSHKGTRQVVLGTYEDGGAVVVVDSEGIPRVSISAQKLGGAVTITNREGNERAKLGATEDGGVLTINNKTGTKVVHAGVDEYGNGVVGVFDRKGKGRALLPGPQ